MAIKTKTDIMNSIKSLLGERTDDEALAFIEDVNDTLNSFDNSDNEDWKKKYEENDNEWRRKYRDRFYGNDDNNNSQGQAHDDTLPDDTNPADSLTLNDIFIERK